MAHEVQAGTVRIKVRQPWQVLLLGWLTSGIYLAYWYYVTTRSMELFDRSVNRGAAGIRALPAMIVGFVAIGGFWLGLYMWFYAGSRASSDAAAGLPPGSTSSSAASMSSILMVTGFVATLIAAGMLRAMALRVASIAGLLPEERGPSGWVHWVASVVLYRLFGPSIGAMSVQTTLNAAWEKYPRYFASLGGTREQVAAEVTPASGPVTVQSPTTATPAHISAPAPAVAVRGMQMPTPPAQQQQQPQQQQQLSPAAQRMVELEPLVSSGTMSPIQAYEYAQASEQVHGPEAAAPWYAYVLQIDSTNVLAAYWYGVFQLGRGDAAGIATLHRAMGDVRTDAHARSQVVAFLTARGRHEEAARYQPGAAAA